MTAPGDTFRIRALVLSRTKLGETDLIVSMLAENGMLVRAVAKGARKPKSPFAARLELGKRVDVLCSKGRNLDIVKECALLPGNVTALSLESASSIAPVVELSAKVAQEGLENPVLYQCLAKAVATIEDAKPDTAPTLCAAALLKVLSFAGLRPALSFCAHCGDPVESPGAYVRVSYPDGGCLCRDCAKLCGGESFSDLSRRWAHALLHSPFEEIARWGVPDDAVRDVLRFSQGIVEAHVGHRLRSLGFLLSLGL